ncbi:MAG: UDP-N-acetylmuramoyl-L-alanyl-D-glutamate--2,6-diaminopimelate ligase [Holosporales bacterium]|nr:UDP-N-acetylmuramoyl-L-alanyl-D-glutamate--2,6-diaminopimelate ligase [Holosporales bacterium]
MGNIRTHSKLVEKHDIFIGIFCEKIKEHIVEAKSNGALLIFADRKAAPMLGDVSHGVIFVDDTRLLASRIAKFTYPAQPECCVAITGTNGKSSIAHFVWQMWHSLGKKAANLGTLGLFGIDGERIDCEQLKVPDLTTPDSFSLHRILDFLKSQDIAYFVFETSSHALHQKRLHSVELSAAAFSNLSADHLDYHGTVEEYLKAKLLLFEEILKTDNPSIVPSSQTDVLQSIQKSHRNIVTFGIGYGANIAGKNIRCYHDRIVFDLSIDGQLYRDIELKLFGDFQLMNLMCAIGLVYACGASPDDIVNIIPRITGLRGRMELVLEKNGKGVCIDYAHTSSAFETSLLAFKQFCHGRLICVFGCGGDRDKSKRREMGQIANEIPDVVIVTDDNPRTENPAEIRAEILDACEKGIEIADRKEAIHHAMNMMCQGDTLVVMGKGHETTQLIMHETRHHDDREEILKHAKLL